MATADVIEMVTRVRKTVGDGYPLMLDPNNGYQYRKAYEIGRTLDELNFHWYEDPVQWNMFDSIIELSSRLRTPLCMSDIAEFRFREAAHFVRMKAVRLPRGSARKIGITGLKKLCSLAEGFGLNCEIGTASNSTLDAANLNVMLSVDNCDYFEWWRPEQARQAGFVDDMKPNAESQLVAPTQPGLGYEWDWPFIEKHTITSLT
jgi:L-alanine-DL-glutamate epimerase-like enolase superfamily enzyme